MNLSPIWAEWFEGVGHEAVHWRDIGPGDAPDERLFAYAQDHAMVVFTHDLDFSTLLALKNTSSPSVLQVRVQNVIPETLGPLLEQVIGQYGQWLEQGALVTVFADKQRLRILPIKPA